LAYVKFEYDWDWAGAESDFRKALQLNSGYPTAHQWYGQYLSAMGRFDEAVAELKRAQDLDPVSVAIQVNVGRVYRYARRYDEAVEQLRAGLVMDPNLASPHFFIALSRTLQSRCSEAMGEYQTALKLSRQYLAAIAYLGYTYARCGKTAEAQETLQELMEISKRGYLPAGLIVPLYAGLGDKDRAFQWLAKAVEERDFDVVWLKIDPLFDLIRSDPRFAEVLHRVNLGP
jgi:tetratricopeptide (TPR) repeat protein